MITSWCTARRTEILIGSMSRGHILNCIRMLERGRPYGAGDNRRFSRQEWIAIFRTELIRRDRHGQLH